MHATDVNESSHNGSTADVSSGRVLIVDDQFEIAQFLAEMLKLVGYETVCETSPQRALHRIEEDIFDVVISDFKMPEMSGSEFFSAATELRPGLVNRFIFLTGDLSNMETETKLAALGVPCLGKPFRLATVEQVVGDVIAKNSLHS
jgi:CheY-like chemotaxis protein